MRQSGSGILRNAGGWSLNKSSPTANVNKKAAASRVPLLPVAGYFYFQIDHWSKQIMDQWPQNPVFRSEIHEMYGNSWELLVFPRGCLSENSSFVEVQVVNRSDGDINAKYTISIVDQSDQSLLYSWSDPDGTVLFGPHGDDDDYWGNCEFMDLSTLTSQPYTQNDSVRFKVDIVAKINDELGALTPTTKPMGDVTPGTCLEIAKSELHQLSSHMSEQKVRMIKEEERLQDTLVSNRVYMMKHSSSRSGFLSGFP